MTFLINYVSMISANCITLSLFDSITFESVQSKEFEEFDEGGILLVPAYER